MSATRRERDEFIYRMAQEGVPLHVVRKVLRYGATLQRLAEAECNGDYPCDNGERKVIPCPRCESGYVRSHIKQGLNGRGCDDCRTSDLVTAALAPYGLKAFFAGDPRGAVVSVVKASVEREMYESGRERGVSVPA